MKNSDVLGLKRYLVLVRQPGFGRTQTWTDHDEDLDDIMAVIRLPGMLEPGSKWIVLEDEMIVDSGEIPS